MRQGTKIATRDRPRPRKRLSKALQVRVFRRDNWLCHWCGRPVIFGPAMRLLEAMVRRKGYAGTLAYWDLRNRRDASPLLDHLMGVLDHNVPHVNGGRCAEENLVVACNKCNALKSDGDPKEPRRRIAAKYGEPKHWDGLSTLFMLFAEDDLVRISPAEREWLEALKEPVAGPDRLVGPLKGK